MTTESRDTEHERPARKRRRVGRLVQAASLTLLSSVSVVGAAVAGAGAAGADVTHAKGYAFGASLKLGGTTLLAPTPLANLGQSKTLATVPVPGVLSVKAVTVTSSQSPSSLPSPAGTVKSSADTADIQVVPGLAGLTSPLIDINAINLHCQSNAGGSSAVLSTIKISIQGGPPQTIPSPPPNTLPNLPIPPVTIPGIGTVTPVIELNREVVVNKPAKNGADGSTSVVADGVFVQLGSLAQLIVGEVSCGVSGPDVEAPPSVTGVSPKSGPTAGGTEVTITGDGFVGVKSVDFCGIRATDIRVISPTEITADSPPHPAGPCAVTVTTGFGTSPPSANDVFTYTSGSGHHGHHGLNEGYWLVASDGGIFTFGHATFYGSAGSYHLKAPIVGMTPAPNGTGYWLVATDGGIFTYGTAKFFGSTGSIKLRKPIVGMAATPDGRGYWLVASDGGIFTFGDAKFFGSTGGLKLNGPIVGMARTVDGFGYYLVGNNGRVFNFGDAKFYGDMGSTTLKKPVVGMSVPPAGNGYWLTATDGGIFTFGSAPFLGSAGNIKLYRPIVGMASSPDGRGYWQDASDGGVFTYGDAKFLGSTGNIRLNKPIVGMAPSFTKA